MKIQCELVFMCCDSVTGRVVLCRTGPRSRSGPWVGPGWWGVDTLEPFNFLVGHRDYEIDILLLLLSWMEYLTTLLIYSIICLCELLAIDNKNGMKVSVPYLSVGKRHGLKTIQLPIQVPPYSTTKFRCLICSPSSKTITTYNLCPYLFLSFDL